MDREDFGRVGVYFGTLGSIVINEDKAIYSKIQLLCNRSQILRLWHPVDASRRDVLAFENHAVVSVKNLPDIRFIVFTDERQQNAALSQGQRVTLNLGVSVAGSILSDLNAKDSILTNDAAPERVIAVH